MHAMYPCHVFDIVGAAVPTSGHVIWVRVMIFERREQEILVIIERAQPRPKVAPLVGQFGLLAVS